MSDWTIEKARATYNIAHWANGYFDINQKGHLVARPNPSDPGTEVDLYKLVEKFAAENLALPVLVRFSGILRHRVLELCAAFDKAVAAHAYQGRYTAVYPIKVNQQKSVIDALLTHGGERLGLEAGSKPELLAVLARARANDVVVCNGYKDREFIRLALIGKRLGHRVFIVVEKLSELELIIEEARALSIEPLLGVRVRLASIGAGKWQNTGGEKSKFGLSAIEILRVSERLRAARGLPWLQMMHFHMGSQIPNIQHVQAGMQEAARYFVELRAIGANIQCINVGGGLAIDYEGTRSRSFCSMNYSIAEYAEQIVGVLKTVCEERGLPHPDIVTESGRAMTAHHAVLITNLIDIERQPGAETSPPAEPDDAQILKDMWRSLQSLSTRPALEIYHDGASQHAEAQAMFANGVLTLAQRARAEKIYFAICREVRERLQVGTRAHRDVLDELNEKLADKYFLNFSLFQSIPDHWAIDQIFPVMPLHRLNEPPTRRAVVQDITCDSDGRIDWYVDGEGVESSLPVHAPRENERYLLGIFLVGAYQEILGDMHNLFGDTDSVHVDLDNDGGYRLSQPRRGDTVDSVLRYVNFDAADLLAAYRDKIDRAQCLDAKERKDYFTALSQGLTGYTYLED